MRGLLAVLVLCFLSLSCEKNQFQPVSTNIIDHTVTFEASVTFGSNTVGNAIPAGTATWSSENAGASEGFSSVWSKYVTDITAGHRLSLTVVCTNPPYQTTAWATATIYVDGNRWKSETGATSASISGVLP